MIPKPRDYLLEQKKRLWARRRAVTLIIGMECSDALLFCADREENTELAGKRSVSKIYDAYEKHWSIIIATAGHGPFSDIAAQRIIQDAKLADGFHLTPAKVIQASLSDLYEQYVFARDERRQRDRDISLIIGVIDKERRQRYLYKTFKEIVKPEAHYACAGMGVDLAYYFLDRFREDSLPSSDEAAQLLAFILREAKSSVDRVGKESEFVSVQHSGRYEGMHSRSLLGQIVDWREIPELSSCMNHFWKKKPPLSRELLKS